MRSKTPFRAKLLLAVISILVLLASIAMVWNTARLQKEVSIRTQQYVSDVTVQLAKDIDHRLSKNIEDLESICDSLLRIDPEESETLDEFLKRKARTFGYSAIVATDTAGGVYQVGTPLISDVFSLAGMQASRAGQSSVSFLDAQQILYSIPIRQNGEIRGVLGGVRDKENMQALIQAESFSGKSLTCIVDRDGAVIISPTDLAPFMQLDSLFDQDPDGALAQRIYRMKEDMRAQRSGIFRFEAVDGADLLLSYNPLGSYDWVLLTLVSSNVISTKLDGYLHQTLFLMVGVIALMVCLILVLFFSWSAHFQTMERAAFIDRVTGAMNENAFRLKCETVLPHAPPGSCSIVLLNIKNFKLLNQQFGSACGNEILCSVMRVLKNWVRGCGYAARADADHFLLCLDTGNPEQIQQKIRQIVMDAAKAVQQLDALKATPIYFVLQPDVYIVDDPTLDFTVILGRAKTACSSRTATEDGVCKFYDHAITARLEKEQALNSLFRSSLENGDFEVYLQPKVRVADEGIGGAEALVRWRHPQHGVIYPSDFIPLFEANGNVCPLDLYVFEGVCKTLRRWRAEGRALFPISVNLSRQHFRNPDCLQAFAAVAEQYEISAGQIEFELTESVFFDDQGIETVKRQIQEMHRLGFGCSLDDFGSGYSSLGLLMEFDVDAIKFDRRFFKDMKNPKLRDLMASLVALSRKMGAQTVAEGIETPEQRALLQEVGCDLIQGYIYARPLPIPEFEAWLDHRS